MYLYFKRCLNIQIACFEPVNLKTYKRFFSLVYQSDEQL